MRRLFETCGHLPRGFANNERGSIAILFGFVLVILGVAIGGAVDFGRYSSAKSQTRAAVDAAVLAGARVLLLGGSASDALAAAGQYYQKNTVSRFTVTSDTIQFQVTSDNSGITGSGNAMLPTTLLQLAGISQLPLMSTVGSSFPTAVISSGGGSDIEVSVMLDVTGSMCDGGAGPCTSGVKLDALRTAAKDLVNIVVRDDQSQYKSRVALVPFAQRIRVAGDGEGASIMAALTGLPATWSGWDKQCTATEYGGTNPTTGGEVSGGGAYYNCTAWETVQVSNWKIRPCVTERFFSSSNTMDFTDDAPGTNAWLNAEDGTRNPVSIDSGANPSTTGLGATADDPRAHWTYSSDGGCNEPAKNVAMPLTADKVDLKVSIDELEANGGTGGALGTAFAWYMLSPNFGSIWSGSAPDQYGKLSELQANGKPKLRKVAILMTDGVYNTKRGWSGQNQQDVSDAAKSICTAMKAKGIEIYTVGFDLDSLPSSEKAIAIDTLQSCGSSIEHFYNSFDPADLQNAFRDIAVKLSSISLSQ